MSAPGFKITGGRGFHITFANGWTVSVQFGPGIYCENYDMPISVEGNRKAGEKGSGTAEVACWGPDGKMISFGDDTVKGYQNPAEVLQLLNQAEEKP
jgi:hypothetical protein